MFDATSRRREARNRQQLWAKQYPLLCGDDSDFEAALDAMGSPGWTELIDRLLHALSQVDGGIDSIQSLAMDATPLGIRIYGKGFSPRQQDITRFAQRESRLICPICGTRSCERGIATSQLSTCHGCMLEVTGKNSMAPGWRGLGSTIVHELEDLGPGPIDSISSRAGALVIDIRGAIMSEHQERCFRLWNNELSNYCEICGHDGEIARCPKHRFVRTIL